MGPLWDSTVGVVTAEFGRRVDMNAAEGTDHGWGYVSFLFGGALNRSGAAVLGDMPLSTFYGSTSAEVLPATTDIRSVIGEVLSGAGMSAAAAFPGFASPRTLGIYSSSPS